MASTGTALIFARIVPQGIEAEDALDSVSNDEHLDDKHRSFIHIEAGPRVRHGDSGSDSSQSNRQPPPKHHSTGAYFTLSLQQPTIQPFSNGWRLGRDTAEVDLLLIRPGKPRRQVAPVHARIRLHVRSGVPMLFSVEGSRPVSYRLHDSAQPLLLSNGRGHVLYQRSNSFSVGQLHYTLEFADFNHDLYQRFVDERNTLLRAFGLPDPHPALSAICRFQDTKRGLTITHGTLSTGKFGIVSAGVTTEYGEPVAIKQHRADNPHDMRRIRREADIGALFKLQQGLMPTLSVWCEHQSAGVCNHLPQAVFTSSPLALCDFTRVLWSNYSLTVIRECLRGVMRGLVTLHTAGFMHRDIHIRNVFLVSSDPPAAVLGDFGKTVQAESHSDDCLGPIHTRAPEVDGRTQYTNKIDIWSLGIVMLSILDPDAQPPGGRIPTLQWHQPVMEYCTRVKRNKNGTLDADVLDLIQQMLTWDLNARPTARQISEHPYFTSDHPCYDGTNAQPIPLPPPVSPQHPTQSIQPVPALAQVASLPTLSAPRLAPQSAPQVFPSSSSSSSSLNIPMPAPFGRRLVSSVQAPRGQAPTTQGSFRQAPPRQGLSGPGPPRQAHEGQGIRQAQGNPSSTESSSSGSFSRPSEPWVPWQPSQGGPAYQPPPGPSSGMPPRRW